MSKRSATNLLILTAVLTANGPALASDGNDAHATESRIAAKLKEHYPELKIDDISPAEIPGLFAVISGDRVAYTDQGAEHVFLGQIIETASRRNLTQARWDTFSKIDFTSLPLALAIKTVHGKGSREIAVFADPLCPFCQELETQLAQLDDLTVYTFLFPLENLHPGATDKSNELWCAHDRSTAWSAWMLQRASPPSRKCSNTPIAEISGLGDTLHVHTTPTIFFRSGQRVSGALGKEQFVNLLDSQSAVPTTAAAAATTR